MVFTKLYTVQLDPKAERPYESAAFIADGFSVAAFLFGPLWALYHRLWWVALLLFCVTQGLAIALILTHVGMPSRMVLQLGLNVMIGFAAGDLRRGGLEKKGWVMSDVVIATSLLEAERRYFDRYLGSIAQAPRTLPTIA